MALKTKAKFLSTGTLILNTPATLVFVPLGKPFTLTETNSSGLLYSSITFPFTMALSFWAKSVIEKKQKISTSTFFIKSRTKVRQKKYK